MAKKDETRECLGGSRYCKDCGLAVIPSETIIKPQKQVLEENPCEGCNDQAWCAEGNPCGGKEE